MTIDRQLNKQYVVEQRVKSLEAMENVLFTLYAGAYSDWSAHILSKFKTYDVESTYDAYWLIAKNKLTYKKYVDLFIKLQANYGLNPKY